MDKFTRDLDEITGGYSASHYLDDEEFNYAVEQMEDAGHGREKTTAAIAAWIDRTPMWDCPECGKEGLDEETYIDCPICGAAPDIGYMRSATTYHTLKDGD